MRRTLPILFILTGLAGWTAPLAAQRTMLTVNVDGTHVTGLPLAVFSDEVALLARDGQLWRIDRKPSVKFNKTTSQFIGYTTADMRDRLVREFGRGFDITGTTHYLVVHPRGQRDQWAGRFETLYRQFDFYFSRRGFQVRRPEYPLVAVVFADRDDFQRNKMRLRHQVRGDAPGYYSPDTNRIYLYDLRSESASPRLWDQTLSLVIHEATHQTAFNTGVHRRFAGTPRWVTEGLATMFEARGVWNSRGYVDQRDRVNRGQLANFKRYLARRPDDSLARFIAFDSMFPGQAQAGYAQAWALTFYLAETRPADYSRYLARLAARPAFRDYTSAQRVADFAGVFGKNLKLLDAHFVRYVQKLR